MSPEVARRVVKLFREFRPPERAPCGLTPQETELLKLLVEGSSLQDCRWRDGDYNQHCLLSPESIYTKLQVHSKSEAVAKALREHLI